MKGELQIASKKDTYVSANQQHCRASRSGAELTLGALGSTAPVEAPMPRLAFHLASDSSSASSCEYSASDFFSPTL